ncbi:MAG: Fur family transcriptional regulator [Spirochaetota bacterium]
MNQNQRYQQPLIARLRDRGWRLTVQRRVVAEALSEPDLHLTADEVYSRARERVPEISKATVYNTLGELTAMGELREVQLVPGPTRYDPNATIVHHHLVCTQCGEISDIQPRGLEHLELSDDDRQGFELEQIEVTFRGRCSSCAAKS